MCQAPRAEVVLVLSRSRSVTPADRSYCDLLDTRDPAYNFINSSRPPKILESPLDSKSLSAGNNNHWKDAIHTYPRRNTRPVSNTVERKSFRSVLKYSKKIFFILRGGLAGLGSVHRVFACL